jgi:hypothetical protein
MKMFREDLVSLLGEWQVFCKDSGSNPIIVLVPHVVLCFIAKRLLDLKYICLFIKYDPYSLYV